MILTMLKVATHHKEVGINGFQHYKLIFKPQRVNICLPQIRKLKLNEVSKYSPLLPSQTRPSIPMLEALNVLTFCLLKRYENYY